MFKKTSSSILPMAMHEHFQPHVLPSQQLAEDGEVAGETVRSSETKIRLTATSREPKETVRKRKHYNCSNHFVHFVLTMVSKCYLKGSYQKVFGNSYTTVCYRKFSQCSINESRFWTRTDAYTVDDHHLHNTGQQIWFKIRLNNCMGYNCKQSWCFITSLNVAISYTRRFFLSWSRYPFQHL